MKYSIPVSKIEKLSKIIKKYQKKGANIVFNLGNEVVEDGTLYIEDARTHTYRTMPIKIRCVEVFVEGTYRINGWSFVGTVQFTKNGNIIRLADSSYEGKVPAKYLHTPQICEHCGTIRNRKDTYLICSDEGEWKQVGSSCLLEYTQGLDADECASIMSCLDKFQNLCNNEVYADEFFSFYTTNCGIDSKSIKAHAISLVRRYGYTRMENGRGSASDLADYYFRNSPDEVWESLYGQLTPASEEEVKTIDEYAQQYINSTNDYMRNASLAWLNEYVESRDFGLICSFASTYIKEMRKMTENLDKSNSKHQGNVGDRITIKVVKARVLYTKYTHYTYSGECIYVQELLDEKGNVYIWSSNSLVQGYLDGTVVDENGNPFKEIYVKGTIKEHTTYKDIEQTVLTRCSVKSSQN